MSQELGKIEKPEAERFRRGKKLYLVPLVYSSEEAPDEYREKYTRYWQQAAEQLHNLASKIGEITRIYHESVYQDGEDGIEAVERLNPSSHQIARGQRDRGATFEPLEAKELLEEVMDWQRCLMLGFMSAEVERKVFELYLDATKRRDQAMAKKIGETLQDDEAGLLFIREGHAMQFPADIEIFSVVPPALDEIHRWYRDQSRLRREEQPADENVGSRTTEKAAKPTKRTGKKGQKKP